MIDADSKSLLRPLNVYPGSDGSAFGKVNSFGTSRQTVGHCLPHFDTELFGGDVRLHSGGVGRSGAVTAAIFS